MKCPLRFDRRDSACDPDCAWCIEGAGKPTCAVREAGVMALLQRKGLDAIATATGEESGSPRPREAFMEADAPEMTEPLGRSHRNDARNAGRSGELITVAEAGDILGSNPWTVRRLLCDGTLRGVKVGQQWRVNRARLLRYCGLE